ncbi:cation diffusion facilitator family transporter [Mesorhizobium xinjiangense]|uniref:cation diffusion facilitator family transporter n=1 Tax=Mesorhizobium xinjiangense TaxID=2678685 RepID=UPI0012EDFF42|nr:cation diffusion facilitator family transporter [Mesorhizobium xinjiangense]
MASQSGSRLVIYAALIGNFLIAVTKFVASWITGSSAMLSEGVHSLVDTGNELLLLHGLRRSEQAPDRTHPFGYGRELYFWSFIVALLVFALGAGVAFYEGVTHILDPEPADNVTVNYAVLAISAVFEGVSWWIGLKEFNRRRGRLGFFEAARQSKDPSVYTVLFEDSAALLGLAIAFLGILFAQLLDMPQLDGVASIGIGCVLGATAVFLARESKGLLMGEPALPQVERALTAIVETDAAVERVNGILTVHLGPEQIVAGLSVEFEDRLDATEIEACVERLEARLRREIPAITAFFVKPQTARGWARRAMALEDGR